MFKKSTKPKVEKISSLNVFLNKNYKTVKLVVFVLIIILLLLFLVQPKSAEINLEKITMFQEKVNELKGQEQYKQGLEELKVTMAEFKNKYSKNIENLSQLLPSEAEVPNLMAQLEAVAQASGFTISTLTVTEGSVGLGKKITSRVEEEALDESLELPELDSAIHVVKVGLNVEGGDYFNLKSLLDNLEKHLRIIDVSSISFSGTTDSSQITLMLDTYYFAE